MAKATNTVYSWYMPEIEDLVADYVQDSYPTEIFKQNFEPGLDGLHEHLLQQYKTDSLRDVFDDSLTTLYNYNWYSYYCNGSSEALFHLIARHFTHFPDVPLYQFEGEYQGYSEYIKCQGYSMKVVPHGFNLNQLVPGCFIVSVPSAIDGNAVDPKLLERIKEANHYVILDCAYAGMGDQPKLTINNRVVAVVGSLSKPFGLYYHRIGFMWSRDPVPSLYGNKWFKNAFSIKLGEQVLDRYFAHALAERYRPWQHRACREASDSLNIEIKPSDVWLLGHNYVTTDERPDLEQFRRGPGYRFCLTPYYMEYAREAG